MFKHLNGGCKNPCGISVLEIFKVWFDKDLSNLSHWPWLGVGLNDLQISSPSLNFLIFYDFKHAFFRKEFFFFFFYSLGTLEVAQNTTAMQIKPDKYLKGIVWFLTVEAGALLGHVPIGSSSKVFVFEKTIMSKISVSTRKQSSPQTQFTISDVLIGKIYHK